MRRFSISLMVTLGLLLAAPAYASVNSDSSASVMPALYKNCTALNAKYPHGVGKLNARDKTSGVPVTTFTRSTQLYNVADGHNGGLDRDNDGIACEKR